VCSGVGEDRVEGLEIAVDVGQDGVPHRARAGSGGRAEILVHAVEDAVDKPA
jgi:hypothetical protein